MRVTAVLTICCADGLTASRLCSVLKPDTGHPPKGLSADLSQKGKEVALGVASGSPSTSISTCLGVLRDATLFQEVWLLTQQWDA